MSNSEQKTPTIADVIVKKYNDNLFIWGIPSLGYCDATSLNEVIKFMERHRLTFTIREATQSERKLENL